MATKRIDIKGEADAIANPDKSLSVHMKHLFTGDSALGEYQLIQDFTEEHRKQINDGLRRRFIELQRRAQSSSEKPKLPSATEVAWLQLFDPGLQSKTSAEIVKTVLAYPPLPSSLPPPPSSVIVPIADEPSQVRRRPTNTGRPPVRSSSVSSTRSSQADTIVLDKQPGYLNQTKKAFSQMSQDLASHLVASVDQTLVLDEEAKLKEALARQKEEEAKQERDRLKREAMEEEARQAREQAAIDRENAAKQRAIAEKLRAELEARGDQTIPHNVYPYFAEAHTLLMDKLAKYKANQQTFNHSELEAILSYIQDLFIAIEEHKNPQLSGVPSEPEPYPPLSKQQQLAPSQQFTLVMLAYCMV